MWESDREVVERTLWKNDASGETWRVSWVAMEDLGMEVQEERIDQTKL